MLQFIGVDLTETQPQLVIEHTDYTPEWRLGDAEAVVQRNTAPIEALAAELVAKVEAAGRRAA